MSNSLPTRTAGFFSTQPKSVVALECTFLVLAIGYVDYLTVLPLSVFYAIPILLTVWHGPRKYGTTLAVLCTLVWFFANHHSHPHLSERNFYWVAFNRLAYFLFVAIGGTAMKNQRDEIRARMEAMTRARALEQEIVRVAEREQMRIGQDIHDGLCQNLAAIDCATACLKSDLEARSVPEASAAGTIQKLLQEAIVEARNLARGISPVHMDAENLPAALEELVASANRSSAIGVTFEMRGEVTIGDTQTAIHLYRIAQEALRNALRHSGATQVVIELIEDGQQYTLSITDDGHGLDDAQVRADSMGLGTIRYRARLLGATCEIKTRPTGGTIVRCTLPLHHVHSNQH